MNTFGPIAILRLHGFRAAIGAAIILGAHWYRYRRLDRADLLSAIIVFVGYLALASWLERRNSEKL